MKRQKVQMILQFSVATDRKPYGHREAELPWQLYAEHDMKQYVKDTDEIPEYCWDTVDLQRIRFEWKPQGRKQTRRQIATKTK